MNFCKTLATIALSLVVCLAALVQAGGDKSAKTTVITLAGGGEKHGSGYPVPIPVPYCAGSKMSHGYGGGHGGYSYGGHGAQARMGWRRR